MSPSHCGWCDPNSRFSWLAKMGPRRERARSAVVDGTALEGGARAGPDTSEASQSPVQEGLGYDSGGQADRCPSAREMRAQGIGFAASRARTASACLWSFSENATSRVSLLRGLDASTQSTHGQASA